jgi:hypothetical protein
MVGEKIALSQLLGPREGDADRAGVEVGMGIGGPLARGIDELPDALDNRSCAH